MIGFRVVSSNYVELRVLHLRKGILRPTRLDCITLLIISPFFYIVNIFTHIFLKSTKNHIFSFFFWFFMGFMEKGGKD